MKTLFLLLVSCHVSSAVKHSLKFSVTGSPGVPNLPEFFGTAEVDGIVVGYCNSNKKTVEPKLDWLKEYLENDTQHLEWLNSQCFENLPNFFKATIQSLKQDFNQSGGEHVLQVIEGCEWDDETGESNGFLEFAYDGKDLISFDIKTLSWIALRPQAVPTKQRWDAEKGRIKLNEKYLIEIYPDQLKKYLIFGKAYLLRTDLPSVSLLQKTPSSPVSCHATGFYPNRAVMFWRKDGEELHEDVDHGEILPNHDGSFQMSIDLNVTSVAPEDWMKYDCVFHFSDAKDLIVTKLDRAAIRTNWVSPSEFSVGAVIGVVVGLLLLLLLCIAGLFIWRKTKSHRFKPADTPDSL